MIIDNKPRLGCKCEQCTNLIEKNKKWKIVQKYAPSEKMVTCFVKDTVNTLYKKLGVKKC